MKTVEKSSITVSVFHEEPYFIAFFALADAETDSTLSETVNIGKFKTFSEAQNFVKAARERNLKHLQEKTDAFESNGD